MVAEHAGLACAACHDGPTPPSADRDLGVATTEGCLACHEDGGGAEVEMAVGHAVLPRHADHPGLDGTETLDCAQCHAHPTGSAALRVDPNGCGLCHADELDGNPPGECRSCHIAPEVQPLTDQGLPVSHDRVPWVEEGCVRCHYAVAPPSGVSSRVTPCTDCHDEDSRTVRAFSAGADANGPLPGGEAAAGQGATSGRASAVHGAHARVPCGACHTEPAHRVEALSSAVGLVCADCHVESHTVDSRSVAAATCTGCHAEDHRPQQGLLLGLVPWSTQVRPSMKFAAGLTCRSCHGVAGAEAGPDLVAPSDPLVSLAGDRQRCVLCHRSEYADVADLWMEGGAERLRRARAWVESRASTVPDSSAEAARARLDFVDAGGFVHGPVLADRLLREAVALTGGAGAGGPELGAPPRDGFCSFCHLDPGGTWTLGEMSDDLHRSVVGAN